MAQSPKNEAQLNYTSKINSKSNLSSPKLQKQRSKLYSKINANINSSIFNKPSNPYGLLDLKFSNQQGFGLFASSTNQFRRLSDRDISLQNNQSTSKKQSPQKKFSIQKNELQKNKPKMSIVNQSLSRNSKRNSVTTKKLSLKRSSLDIVQNRKSNFDMIKGKNIPIIYKKSDTETTSNIFYQNSTKNCTTNITSTIKEQDKDCTNKTIEPGLSINNALPILNTSNYDSTGNTLLNQSQQLHQNLQNSEIFNSNNEYCFSPVGGASASKIFHDKSLELISTNFHNKMLSKKSKEKFVKNNPNPIVTNDDHPTCYESNDDLFDHQIKEKFKDIISHIDSFKIKKQGFNYTQALERSEIDGFHSNQLDNQC